MIQCQSTPSGSDVEQVDDQEELVDDGGTEEEEVGPEVFQLYINENESYSPYQQTVGIGNLDIERRNLEYGDYPVVIGADTVMARIKNSINYLSIDEVLGIDLSAEGNSFDDVVFITIPEIESGEYILQVLISDEYIYETMISIIDFIPVTSPRTYSQEQVASIETQFSNIYDFSLEGDEDFNSAYSNDLVRFNELYESFTAALDVASDEEIRELAYFIRGNSKMLNEDFTGGVLKIRNTDPCLASTPEEALDLMFDDIKKKLSFSGFLQIFEDTQDPNEVEVGEPSLIDMFVSWTNTGKALSLISSIKENFKCVWYLTTDSISSELEQIGSESSKKYKLTSQTTDTLYIEAGFNYQLSFTGVYESKESYSRDDFGRDELWVPVVRIQNIIEDFSFVDSFRFLNEPKENTKTEKINAQYLELISDLSTERELGVDIQKDTETGDFIITTNEPDEPFLILDRDYQFEYKPFADKEYRQEITQYLTISSCPDFSRFIPGKWEIVYYKDDKQQDIFQIDRTEYFENGTWRKKEYILEGQLFESDATGVWSGDCNDGNGWVYITDDFFGVTWSFEYTGDRSKLYGYRWRYDTTVDYEGPTQVFRRASF